MRWRRLVSAVVGALATVLAALAVLNPPLVSDIAPLAVAAEALSGANLQDLLTALVFALLLLVAWVARSSGGDGSERAAGGPGRADGDDELGGALERRPERVTADEHALTGADLDADVSRAVDGDDETLDRLRDRLRSLAVTRLARREPGTEAARRAVDAGTWTERRTAAAFLAGSDGPSQSLRARIQLWLDPEAERERRIAATVDALAGIDGGAR